jgi:hypothetical protein
VDAVVDAFQRGDFAALKKLPFSLDEDGDPDTSSVRLEVAYTASGDVLAAGASFAGTG